MKRSFSYFAEGFIGSFILASVIIMAIPRAIGEYVHNRVPEQHNGQ